MNFFVEDQIAGEFGGLVRIRLGVAVEDLHLIGLAADLETAREVLPDFVERVGIRFAE